MICGFTNSRDVSRFVCRSQLAAIRSSLRVDLPSRVSFQLSAAEAPATTTNFYRWDFSLPSKPIELKCVDAQISCGFFGCENVSVFHRLTDSPNKLRASRWESKWA